MNVSLQPSKLIGALVLLFSVLQLNAQIYDPVKWYFEVEEKSDGSYDLQFRAEIEEHWHLYTQETVEDGPVATSFNFEKLQGVKINGAITESKSKVAFEEILGLELAFFEDEAIFTQNVKMTGNGPGVAKGYLEFMVCDDKQCLPPTLVDFEFKIPVNAVEMVQVESAENPGVEIVMGGSDNEEGGILDPVDFEIDIEDLGEGMYNVVAKGKIDKGWHVYSSELESDDGPLPTVLVVETSENISLEGKIVEEGEMVNEYDNNFLMNLSFYKDEVAFSQKVKVSGEGVVKGYLEFMTCDDEKCLPPEMIEFAFDVSGGGGKSTLDAAASGNTGADTGYWRTFILGFLGGFLALLTPCVFPMIPLTVSFFTKQSKTKAKGVSNAIIYGVSIIVIYVLLGYGVTAVFGADALNALSTNVWFNLFFFVMLVVFAISFFGAFEITLPSSWVNKADMASDKGGFVGIFFMAFTLSLVSFSCTGPIIGTLLVDAAVNGGVLGPLIGMFGFSLALAMPFGLFAAFPGWLNSLPSSGGWLNSVKVVLGFLELAFAFKFLSNADLVVQAGLLKREIFIAIWIAIFSLLTAYLLGLFRLPHDSPSDKISVTRLLTAVVSLMFTIYLIPGIWGAPLNLISGFPPPMFYSESPNGLGGSAAIAMPLDGEEIAGDPAHCPHNLSCFHDYDEGMAYAKKVGKPVMLDFTGWACVNCRKMEEQVWSDPTVLKILRNDIVLISLYVDEKLDLPEDEQIEVEVGGKTKKLRTVGNKWSYLQASRYNTNSQPYYVIIDHEEKTMNGSAAYDPDVQKFRNWLEDGIDRFNNESSLVVR